MWKGVELEDFVACLKRKGVSDGVLEECAVQAQKMGADKKEKKKRKAGPFARYVADMYTSVKALPENSGKNVVEMSKELELVEYLRGRKPYPK